MKVLWVTITHETSCRSLKLDTQPDAHLMQFQARSLLEDHPIPVLDDTGNSSFVSIIHYLTKYHPCNWIPKTQTVCLPVLAQMPNNPVLLKTLLNAEKDWICWYSFKTWRSASKYASVKTRDLNCGRGHGCGCVTFTVAVNAFFKMQIAAITDVNFYIIYTFY